MSFVGTGGLCERAADSRGDPRVRPLGIFAAHEFFTALADAPDPRFLWNEGADVAVVTGNDRAIGVDQRRSKLLQQNGGMLGFEFIAALD